MCKYSEQTPNVYVATGFNKWGMTSSMVSAMIISDMILDKENDFSEIFSPKRFDLSLSIGNIANDMIETAKNFIAQKGSKTTPITCQIVSTNWTGHPFQNAKKKLLFLKN